MQPRICFFVSMSSCSCHGTSPLVRVGHCMAHVTVWCSFSPAITWAELHYIWDPGLVSLCSRCCVVTVKTRFLSSYWTSGKLSWWPDSQMWYFKSCFSSSHYSTSGDCPRGSLLTRHPCAQQKIW
jgi:hypothetical protein